MKRLISHKSQKVICEGELITTVDDSYLFVSNKRSYKFHKGGCQIIGSDVIIDLALCQVFKEVLSGH